MVEKDIIVHGICSRCGFYLDGYASRVVLVTLEEGDVYPLHVHFTLTCPLCGRLINLVSVTKEPLKKKEE